MLAVRDINDAFRGLPAYLWPDRVRILLAWLLIVVAVVTNAMMIWLIGKPFNLLQQGAYEQVYTALIQFAVVVLINQAAQMTGGMVVNHIGFHAIGRLRNALLRHCLNLSFPVLGRFSRGDLLARLSSDVDEIKTTLVNVFVFSVSHVLTLALYISMLFWIDLELALWALALSPLFLLQQRIFSPLKRRAAERFYFYNGRLLGLEEQLLANSRGISNFTAETRAGDAHESAFARARRWIIRERNIDLGFSFGFSLLIYLIGLVIVLLGVEGIRDGRFGIGHLVSFLLYLGYLTVPSRGLAETLFQAVGGAAAARRIGELRVLTPRVTDRASAQALSADTGDIVIENLHFGFDDAPLLFRDLNLHISAGETIAIVGPSGAGKTSFASLLLRHFDPQQGRILIGGRDIRDVTLASLRATLTVVSQEPFLLSDTIRANLLMVRPDADDEKLREACRRAFADEFIDKLPDGLNTMLGSGGVQLSAGQQQRLSLSQAFLRDTPVLIMDEATSALDSHSEEQVNRAMEALRRGRTTLIIAHRYSSLKSAGRVFYFNGDGSVTVGEHEELMQSHPGYRQAVAWQTGQD